MESCIVKRTENIIFLRAIATIAVVFYHSRPSLEIGSVPHYLIALIFNWCVPIFFMISGALFLNNCKHVDFKYMINKILHIIKIIFVWGFIYNIVSSVLIQRTFSFDILKESILMILSADTTYCYQFWYLYVLVGIYLFIPIFKLWTDNYIKSKNAITGECIILSVIWLTLGIVIPTVCYGFGVESDIWFGAFKGFSGYLFYVLCGRIYECIGSDKRYSKYFCIITITFTIQLLFFVVMIILGKYSIISTWYGYESFFTWNMASVIYLAVKKFDFSKVNPIFKKIYTAIAKYSLPIYILHVIILQIIRKIGFTNDIINPWIYPIINVSITVGICFLIAYICKRLPIIKHLF